MSKAVDTGHEPTEKKVPDYRKLYTKARTEARVFQACSAIATVLLFMYMLENCTLRNSLGI